MVYPQWYQRLLADLAVGAASTHEVLVRSRVYDGERLVPIRSDEAWDRLAIDPELLTSVPEETERQYRDTVRLFGLSEDS